MTILHFAVVLVIGLFVAVVATAAQENHDHMKGMATPMQHSDKMAPKSVLKPAEGASIRIISPTKGQILKGDKVPIEFKLVKGKRGNHAHAYVDGEMMGMFESEKGTLNGIKPGKHTLVLRVAGKDHQTELDASDKVEFTVK